jgi:hypothetical protein
MFSSLLSIDPTTDINLAAIWYAELDNTGSVVRFFVDDTHYRQITGDAAKAYVVARQAWLPKTTDEQPRYASLLRVSATLDISTVQVQSIDVQDTRVRFFFSPTHYKDITGQDAEDYKAMRQRHMPKLRNVFQQIGEV